MPPESSVPAFNHLALAVIIPKPRHAFFSTKSVKVATLGAALLLLGLGGGTAKARIPLESGAEAGGEEEPPEGMSHASEGEDGDESVPEGKAQAPLSLPNYAALLEMVTYHPAMSEAQDKVECAFLLVALGAGHASVAAAEANGVWNHGAVQNQLVALHATYDRIARFYLAQIAVAWAAQGGDQQAMADLWAEHESTPAAGALPHPET